MSRRAWPETSAGQSLSRRGLVLQGAAFSLAAAAEAAPTHRSLGRIDLHHHYIPPRYLEEAPPAGRALRNFGWSPQCSLEEMDRNGVAVGMLSFPTPLFWEAGREPGRRLARLCNDYAAQMRRDHPRRFGLFASLPPLADTEGGLAEIDYAYGALGADGVSVVTSYAGRYLGDPAFSPLWDELDRRNGVVFVHPTDPACCLAVNDGVPVGFAEWPFDTARTILSLWSSGAQARWPRLRFVFSHGGGGLAPIADRINNFGRPGPAGTLPIRDAHAFFRTLYFDVANAANPASLAAARAIAGPGRLMFGTDYPFIATQLGVDYLARSGLPAVERRAIDRDNALALFPRLAVAAP